MAWFVTLALQLALVWVIVKFFIEVFSWILLKKTGIKLEVGSLWILSIRDVVVQLHQPSVTFSIGSVGLSSCIINTNVDKLFAIVINDVRIEISKPPSKSTSSRPDSTSTNKSEKKTLEIPTKKVNQLLTLLNYVGVHGHNVSFTATSFFLPNCLLHSSVQELKFVREDFSSSKSGANVLFRCLGFQSKVLQRETPVGQDGTDIGEGTFVGDGKKPCIAELAVDISVMLEIAVGSPSDDVVEGRDSKLIRTFSVGVSKTKVSFTDVFLERSVHVLEKKKAESSLELSGVSESKSSHPSEESLVDSSTSNTLSSTSSPSTSSSSSFPLFLLPAEFLFTVCSLDACFTRDNKVSGGGIVRSLNLSLGKLSAHFRGKFFLSVDQRPVPAKMTSFHDATFPNVCGKISLLRASLTSKHVQLLSLQGLSVDAETSAVGGRKLTVGVDVTGLHYRYHIEECNYWIPTIKPVLALLSSSKTKKAVSNSSSSSPSPVASQLIPNSISVNISSTSTSASFMSVKGGSITFRTRSLKIAGDLSGTGFSDADVGSSTSKDDVSSSVVTRRTKIKELLEHVSASVVVEEVHAFFGEDVGSHRAKFHRWNDFVFNEKLEITVDIEPDVAFVEVELSTLRFGWATESLKVFRELFSLGVLSKKSSAALHPPAAEGVRKTLHENNVTRLTSAPPLHAPPSEFLKKLSLTVKLNSLNAIACCDYNVGIVIRWDSLSLTGVFARKYFNVAASGLKIHSTAPATKEWNFECLDSNCIAGEALHLKEMKVKRKSSSDGSSSLTIDVNDALAISWSHSLHLTAKYLAEEMISTLKVVKTAFPLAAPNKDAAPLPPPPPVSTYIPIQTVVNISGPLSVQIFVSTSRWIQFSSKTVVVTGAMPWFRLKAPEVIVSLDEHDVLNAQDLNINFTESSARMRDGIFAVENSENRCIDVEMKTFNFVFPFQYDVDGLKEAMVNTIKWLKLIHHIKPKPFTADSTLPPDVLVKFTEFFRIQLTCDPFEVKLLNNYDLLSDEFKEAAARRQKLEDRIMDRNQRGGHIGIGADKALSKAQIEDLWEKLKARNADIYIQRSKKLYDQPSSTIGRESLMAVVGSSVELSFLADRSIHGKMKVVAAMRDMDVESPYPKDGVDYSTLWCRFIHWSFKDITMKLHDYPQPLVELKEGYLVGRLCGAEICPQWRSIRYCTQDLGAPWSPAVVERSMCPLKFYHDLNGEMDSAFMAHGPCWDPALSECSTAFDFISAPSLDPSPPLPFWDKMRLLFHGRLTLSTKKMKFQCLTSLDPYNQTEMLDLVWSGVSSGFSSDGGSGNWKDLGKTSPSSSSASIPQLPQIPAILDWTNGKIAFRGFFDSNVRTASKYDDCHFVHIPHLRLEIHLDWQCPGGNPNDHVLVACTAPDRVHDVERASTHDSFRAFRSSELKVTMDFKTVAPKQNPRRKSRPVNDSNETDGPTFLLYASTLRWLKDFRQIFSTVGRPIRKGKLFNTLKKPKKQLGRHVSVINGKFHFHKVCFRYWASHAQQYGVEINSGVFQSWNRSELRISPFEDGLLRRAMSNWEITSWEATWDDVRCRLCSAQARTKSGFNVEAVNRGTVDRKFFLRLQRIAYERRQRDLPSAGSTSNLSSSDAPQTAEAARIRDELLRADSPLPDADERVPETEDEVETATAPSNVREQLIKSKEPFHRLQIFDLKASWNVTNRDIIYGLLEAYQRAQTLNICLSTEALKTVKVEEKSKEGEGKNVPSTPVKSRSSSIRGYKPSSPMTQITMEAHSAMMKILEKKEIENRQWVHCEDNRDVNEETESLQGVKLVAKLNDVINKVCRIEFHNSQIMLRGQEEPGYLIVVAAKAVAEENVHKSVWKNNELRAKSSWHASLEGMQYFATVEPQVPTVDDEDVEWVKKDVIEDPVGELNLATPSDGVAIPGSGREVGGVISDTVGAGVGNDSESRTQLQRIISRCGANIYYVTYSNLAEVGQDNDVQVRQEEDHKEDFHKGISGEAFSDENTCTICHHDLNMVSNTYQFHLVLDILNNVLFYVAPHTKEANAMLLRERLSMMTLAEQKKPILKLQNDVRAQISMLRQYERELYFIHRKLDEVSSSSNDAVNVVGADPSMASPMALEASQIESARLENRVNECKRSLMADADLLRAKILSYREHRMLQERVERARSVSGKRRRAEAPAEVVRRLEVSFQHANWKLNEKDGQLSTAEIHLRRFLYTRVNKDDNSGEHNMELGHVKVENLLPAYSNTSDKDVVEPEKEAGSASSVFRFVLKEVAPVGGIPVKERFELNVTPLKVNVQKEFYDKIMDFFFPDRGIKSVGVKENNQPPIVGKSVAEEIETHDSPDESDNMSVYSEASGVSAINSAALTPLPVPHPRKKGQAGRASMSGKQNSSDFLNEMERRAEQNKTFRHVKIPDIEVRVSFKGEKEGRVGVGPPNINDWKFTIPTIEYRNMTWTYLDLVKAIRKDCIRSVLTQIPRQLIGVKQAIKKETSEEEKKNLLLGNYSESYTLPSGSSKNKDGKKGPFRR